MVKENFEKDKIIFQKVNEYFNNLKKCDLKFKHHHGECCYLGTTKERLEKYKEFKILLFS